MITVKFGKVNNKQKHDNDRPTVIFTYFSILHGFLRLTPLNVDEIHIVFHFS